MKEAILFTLGIWLLCSCSPLSRRALQKDFRDTEATLQHHAGFVIYDPALKKTLFEYQAERYFTPASNTKILTLFSALCIIGDSVPGLQYIERGDSLIFWGVGDPSFLYKETFSNDRVYSFLKTTPKTLYFSSGNFHTTAYGPGWAWDDYNDYYSPERSPLPVYGNCFSVYPLPDQFLVTPSYFKSLGKEGPWQEKAAVIRNQFSNEWLFLPGRDKKFRSFTIPFRTDGSVISTLLADTLGRFVGAINIPKPPGARLIRSVPADSLYKVMMQESDNFIAEQLLMMCAGILSDSLNPQIAIKAMQKNHFADMVDRPVWVDGSGLSRYNLFTPRFLVQLWSKIDERVPSERLFPLLATGGKSGTLKNWYKAEAPYIFGKTGTLSNNHSLSGFLVTRSGKKLIFAFMNGNFTAPVSVVRTNMQRILKNYYENY